MTDENRAARVDELVGEVFGTTELKPCHGCGNCDLSFWFTLDDEPFPRVEMICRCGLQLHMQYKDLPDITTDCKRYKCKPGCKHLGPLWERWNTRAVVPTPPTKSRWQTVDEFEAGEPESGWVLVLEHDEPKPVVAYYIKSLHEFRLVPSSFICMSGVEKVLRGYIPAWPEDEG